jgi:hypothetical protein
MKLLIVLVVLAVLFGLFYLANRRYTRRAPGPHNHSDRRSQTTFYSTGPDYGGGGGDGGGI